MVPNEISGRNNIPNRAYLLNVLLVRQVEYILCIIQYFYALVNVVLLAAHWQNTTIRFFQWNYFVKRMPFLSFQAPNDKKWLFYDTLGPIHSHGRVRSPKK